MISRLATRSANHRETGDTNILQMRCEEVEALRAENRRLREEIERLSNELSGLVLQVGLARLCRDHDL